MADSIPPSSFDAIKLFRKYNIDRKISQSCSMVANKITFRTDEGNITLDANEKSPLRWIGKDNKYFDLKSLYSICTYYIKDDYAQFVLDTTMASESPEMEIEMDQANYEPLHRFLSNKTDIFNGFDANLIEQYKRDAINNVNNNNSKNSSNNREYSPNIGDNSNKMTQNSRNSSDRDRDDRRNDRMMLDDENNNNNSNKYDKYSDKYDKYGSNRDRNSDKMKIDDDRRHSHRSGSSRSSRKSAKDSKFDIKMKDEENTENNDISGQSPPYKRRKLNQGGSISTKNNNNDSNSSDNYSNNSKYRPNSSNSHLNYDNSIDLTSDKYDKYDRYDRYDNNKSGVVKTSLGKQRYQVTSIMDENELNSDIPFWRTLPMPKTSNNLKNGNNSCFNSDNIDNNGDRDMDDDSYFREFVREDGTRNSILNSTNNRKTLNHLCSSNNMSKLSKNVKNAAKNPCGIVFGSQKIRLSEEQKALNQRKEIPIIVVPSSLSSLISTANAKDFLEKQEFNQNKGDKLGTVLTIQRPSKLVKGGFATFEIMNQPRDNKQWSRVAAVFVVGKKWQFRNWPVAWQSPEKIFAKVCGFYLHWADAAPNGEVLKWRVNYLGLSRVNKHDHARVANIFWTQLYANLASHHNKKLFY